jgi:hypothetical protein
MIVITHRGGHTNLYTTEEKTIIVITHRGGHTNHYTTEGKTITSSPQWCSG